MKNNTWIIVIILVVPYTAFSQMIWNTSDSISLTPRMFETPGVVKFSDGKAAKGHLTIDLSEKEIYFNDSVNSFVFERGQLASIATDYYGASTIGELFSSSTREKMLEQYRAINYEDFKLNKVSFSLSKNSSYTINAKNKVAIKNESKMAGKICVIDLYSLVVVDSDGDLKTLTNKEFNYLEFNGKRFLKCQELYNFFYEEYKVELKKYIKLWNDQIIAMGVEEFMKKNGSIDKELNISGTKRLLTWEKNNSEYRINVSTGTFSSSTSYSNLYSTTNENTLGLFNSYAPSLFMSRDISHFGTLNGLINSTTRTIQSGTVESVDQTVNVSLLVDVNNSILDVYTKNVFYSPRYGNPFQFIQ